MKLFLFLSMLFMSMMTFAQEVVEAVKAVVPVPEIPVEVTLSNLAELIMYLVKNWSALGTLGIASTILVIIVSVLKGPWCKGWFGKRSPAIKRFIIICLGQIIGVIVSIISGDVWYTAIIQGILVSGGGVLIFEALKPLLKKKDE